MTSIILAAGMGRRLSMGIPKCLIEIAGVSILKRQIAAFRAVGVERFAIVVGYHEQDVRRHLADDAGAFTFILNPRFAETNTIYSLYLAREHFGAGFFYANGDVVFDERLVRLLMPVDDSTRMAVNPGRWGHEEVKVMAEQSPRAAGAGVRISRIGKQLDPSRSLGEFIGVARFGGRVIPSLEEALIGCVQFEGIVDDHFELAVDRLCVGGHIVTPVDIQDLPCCELDFPEDLEQARFEIGPRLQS